MQGNESTFNGDYILVSKTDPQGKITYVNEAFIRISGYSEDELLGQPHNIVRHPEMPSTIFKLLWECVQAGVEINAYVVNRTKEGGYYWVLANVTASKDTTGRVIGFHSTRRRPTKEALKHITSLYETLRLAEKQGGINAGKARLNTFLSEKGVSYEEFILSI